MATNQIAIFVCINLCFNNNVINHFHSSSLFVGAGHFATISLFRRGFYIELNSYFKQAVLMWLFIVCHVLKDSHVLTTVCCLPCSCLYQCCDVAMRENESLFRISRVGLQETLMIFFVKYKENAPKLHTGS